MVDSALRHFHLFTQYDAGEEGLTGPGLCMFCMNLCKCGKI